MHRVEVQKARKTGTVDDAAAAVMEEQVRDTYVEHDRELSNPGSRQLFEESRPELDADQREVLDTLFTDGLAVIPFTKLFDDSLWQDIATESAGFERRVEDVLASGGKPGKPGKPGKKAKDGPKAQAKAAKEADRVAKKKFILHRSIAPGTELTFANPWLRTAASERLIDVVNSYLGLWTKLSYLDQWYTVPGGDEAERVGSQRWHRDYNDQYLVKAFIYMDDVDAGSGPFEYVPGSARGGPYENEWPWQPLGDTYPDQDEFYNRIPSDAARTLTAPAGTMILCNTSGFHRGGFATERRRIIGVLNYVSPAGLAALVERNFTVDPSSVPPDVPEQVRYALT
jgi:hypothetical protein